MKIAIDCRYLGKSGIGRVCQGILENINYEDNQYYLIGNPDKLIEYKKYKEITEVFKILESKRKDIYIKGPEKISNYIMGPVLNNEGYTVDDLTGAFLNFLKRKEQEKPINTKIVDKEYSVKERKQNIRNILHQKHKVKFQELFNEYNRPYLIVTFLSVLEMTKDKEIIIRQERNFDDILIEEVV